MVSCLGEILPWRHCEKNKVSALLHSNHKLPTTFEHNVRVFRHWILAPQMSKLNSRFTLTLCKIKGQSPSGHHQNLHGQLSIFPKKKKKTKII